MGSQTAPALGVTIDVLNDLASTSDLKRLVSSNGNVVFQLATELAKYRGQPISAAAGIFSASVTLGASPTWTAGPVTFSLASTAKCTVTVAKAGEDFDSAQDVSDPATTTNVQLPPEPDTTYINIDLDFSISGNAGGSGTASGIAISGKAAGSAATTLSFCQPVPSNTETLLALRNAFSDIIFPTSPDVLVRMTQGSSARMTFDGTLNWQLEVDYGLGDYKLSAPSSGLLQQSLQKAYQNLTLPSAEIKVGVSATVAYSHTDHFALIVERQSTTNCLVYLTRAAQNESSVTAGIAAGVTTTGISATVDTSQLQQTVEKITGSSTVATQVTGVVASKIDDLESSALAKLNDWIEEGNGDAGLSAAFKVTGNRIILFNYSVDLTRPVVAEASWSALLSNNVSSALNVPGFTLLPGSGIANRFKQSTTVKLQFFNLYKYTNVTDFFDNCTVELAADGTIRILRDIGDENLVTSNSSSGTVRIYFSATATEDPQGAFIQDAIDLNIEISEKNNPKLVPLLTGMLNIVNQSGLRATIAQMQSYATRYPKGTLTIDAVMQSSAFGRLTCSKFTGGINGKPLPNQSQGQDKSNWQAIHQAAVTLMSKQMPFVTPWTYEDWQVYNSYCNTGSADSTANRRNFGPINNVPSDFWKGNEPNKTGYFLDTLARGLNLFEDLITIGNDSLDLTKPSQWQTIQTDLPTIVKQDINTDYAKPIMAAILAKAASAAPAQMAVSTSQDASSFTAKLVLS